MPSHTSKERAKKAKAMKKKVKIKKGSAHKSDHKRRKK